ASDSVSSRGSKLTAIPASRGKVKDGTSATPVSLGNSSSKDEKDGDSGRPAPAPSSPSTGENSLYRIAADGTVREVFREKALVLSLLKKPGRFFVGTGMGGQLFEVDETTKEKSEIARLDHGQILCMVRRHDGSIVIGTGDPG